MTRLRLVLLTTSILGLACAPGAARAQDVPPAPPQFPGTPLGPAPPEAPAVLPSSPPGVRTPSRKRWYGWQILTATLASDTLAFAGFFSGRGGTLISQPDQPAGGWALFAAGLIGHGVSGPIIHLAHHQPLKALASLGLEAALPAAAFGVAFAPCHPGGGDGFPCLSQILGALVLVPATLSAGTAIDSAALAWEDRPASGESARPVAWSLAPVVLPALHAGSAHPGPVPVGAGLVGAF